MWVDPRWLGKHFLKDLVPTLGYWVVIGLALYGFMKLLFGFVDLLT